MKYQRYPAYKDSGIDWLGSIPAYWEVKRLKHISSKIGSGKTPRGGNEVYTDKGVLFVRSQNVYDDGLRLEDVAYIPEAIDEEMSETRVCPGDILLNITGASLGRTCIVPETFTAANVNQHVCIIRIQQSELRPFISLVMKSMPVKAQIDVAQNGAAREGLNFTQISMLGFGLPPLEEQKAIATFLDREIAKIDALLAKQEQLITILQEKRQALISYVVTKGLNPDAQMKDSGIEGLGQIPEHWSLSVLGYESTVKARLGWKGLKAEEYVDDGYAFLSTPNIKDIEIDFDNVNYISQERYEESPEIQLIVGDVLVTKDGSTVGTSNVVRYLPRPATVNSSIAVIRPKTRVSGVFLYYVFMSNLTQGTIQRVKGGMGVPHLFQADLRKFRILVPPYDEQISIACYLDQETALIDKLIVKAQQAVLLLKERRSALISAAVTGKIDVRDLVN